MLSERERRTLAAIEDNLNVTDPALVRSFAAVRPRRADSHRTEPETRLLIAAIMLLPVAAVLILPGLVCLCVIVIMGCLAVSGLRHRHQRAGDAAYPACAGRPGRH